MGNGLNDGLSIFVKPVKNAKETNWNQKKEEGNSSQKRKNS